MKINLYVFILIFSYIQFINTRIIRKRFIEPFPVSIIHINDFHARFEETNSYASPCNPGEKCIGGYARTVGMVKKLLKERNNTNPIYLNAGDSFQGTLWYNIGRWNVTSQFLNMLPADAMTLGNHEFDHGIEGVVPFLETINSPMVVANIDDTEEPTIQGKYNKSVIIDRYDRKIGVIGVILQSTDEIADTGKLKFLNESLTVKEEAEKLKQQGVDIIIVLSHCGLDVDRIIAEFGGPHIDVIVGGHSHSFLFTGDKLPGPEKPVDKYPVEIIQKDTGNKVLIVQAAAYSKYVGDLTVYFDENGNVHSYEGAPVYLDNFVEQDKEILEALKPWKDIINSKGQTKIGTSKVLLSKAECNFGECNIGNFIADAFIHEYAKDTTFKEYWTPAAISMIQVGGIRTSINPGDITLAHLITTLPFENTLLTFDIQGKYLLEVLEFSVSKSWETNRFNGRIMLQHSGLQVVFNVTKPINERVVEVNVRCQKCDIPSYEPLDINKIYRVIAQDFLASGGDGFTMIQKNMKNVQKGRKDIDVVTDFVRARSPIVAGIEGRITVHT